MSWPALRQLLDAGPARGIRPFFAGMAEPDRRALFAPLTGYARELAAAMRSWELHSRFLRDEARARRLVVAVLACAPSASAAAAVLGRATLRDVVPDDPAQAVAVATDRGVTWLGDLGRTLGAGLRASSWARGFPLVHALMLAGGGPWPTGEGFVRGWLHHRVYCAGTVSAVVAEAAADPALDELVPRLFEVDGLRLEYELGRSKVRRIEILSMLAEQGRLDRGMLLDRCVDRMSTARGPADIVAFAVLHDRLAPAPAEIGARAVGYAGLLAAGHLRAATLAQRELRTAEQAGAVELDAILDATPGVLLRTEKALVRTQFGWLDALAERHRDRAGDVLSAVAAGLDSPEPEMRDRASALIGRHLAHAGPAAADLRAAMAGGPAPDGAAADVLPVPAVAPFPDPVTDPDELAAELTVLAAELSAVRLDRVLDSLVRLAVTDRPALVVALEPLLARHFGDVAENRYPRPVLARAVHTFAGSDRWTGFLSDTVRRFHDRVLHRDRYAAEAPERLWVARIAEAALAAGGGPTALAAGGGPTAPAAGGGQRFLVATPTWDNGLLDPEVLTDRLRLAAREGWEPGPVDLTQALLRLPHPGVPADLPGDAGKRLAGWIAAGGNPEPLVTREPPRRGVAHVLVRSDPPPSHPDEAGLYAMVAYRGHTGPPSEQLWASVTPACRELVAAHAVHGTAQVTIDGFRGGGTRVLPMLAATVGPLGPASMLALSYGLAAKSPADRLPAVDAVLLMAGAGDLDPAALGAEIGTLAADGVIVLNRVVEALTGVVHGGAPRLGWQILRTVLPPLLTAAKPPAATAAALSLATEALAAGGAGPAAGGGGGPGCGVAGLAEVAARSGSSRLIIEARRLRDAPATLR